jgi:hypothetical protein
MSKGTRGCWRRGEGLHTGGGVRETATAVLYRCIYDAARGGVPAAL